MIAADLLESPGEIDLFALSERVRQLELQLAPAPGRASTHVTCHLVIEIVALESGVPPQLILSAQRGASITRARCLAMWLCCNVTGKSLPVIGRAFDRDHTTVIAARDKAEQLRGNDLAFFRQSNRLYALFTGGDA